MPLYEYQCDACGARFERIQKFSDAPVTVCPTCGGAVRKLISSPAIQFKGSGFYITDYAKPGSKDSEKSDKSDKTAPAAPAAAQDGSTAKSDSGQTSGSSAATKTGSGDAAGGSSSTPAPKTPTPPAKS